MISKLAGKFQISEEFIVKLKAKDRKAYEELYDNYSATLLGIAYKITNDEDVANDVLQDAFVKIWKNISFFDANKATLFTWMLNITRNTAIDAIRKKSFRSNIQIDDKNVDLVDTKTNTNINITTIGVRELVANLRPDYQKVIDAVYFNNLTHEEASEELNLPLGTLKTRVRNALIELKTIFKK